MTENRRDFLRRFIPNFKPHLPLTREIQDEIHQEKQIIENKKENQPKNFLSRRMFVLVLAEFLGITIADHLLDSLPTRLLRKYLQDSDFRQLVHSRSPQELVIDFNEVRESRIDNSRDFQIEKMSEDIIEGWMLSTFDDTKIYSVTEKDQGFSREKFIAVCEVGPVSCQENEDNSYFNRTDGFFATLPSSAILEGTTLPALYAAYTTDQGVAEFFDQYGSYQNQRSPDRGALIVDLSGRCRVVNPLEARNFNVNQNCLAIESCAFVLDSDLPEDIEAFSLEETESGKLVGNSQTFTTCTCTYYFPDGTYKTCIVSSYQEVDLVTGSVRGVMGGDAKYSPKELFALCQKVGQNFNILPNRLVMQVPDPGIENQSLANTNMALGQEDLVFLGNRARALTDTNAIGPAFRLLGGEKPFGVPKTKRNILVSRRHQEN